MMITILRSTSTFQEKHTYDDDEEDAGVFKCMDISVEDDIIVVYRSKYNTRTKKWGKVNLKDPIHVDDIQKCHRNKKFIKIMNSILFSKKP